MTAALVQSEVVTDSLGQGVGAVAELACRAEAAAAGARMSSLLAGVQRTGERPLQEPYSIRCTPQLLGAAGSAITYAGGVIDNDLNGVNDDLCRSKSRHSMLPCIFPG